ncbi:MAG TPA: DeoR/GlpR family DNA-binding transcription regulator [Jiangellaceae bacterium]|nr:DeoR/GlpR family DNA-binding transcription regulator [Jiangellaceae bacterium]
MTVLAAERQAKIVQEIQRRGAARVADLVDLFGVSDMTIRRDLDALAQQGLIDKVHGGATRRARSTHEPGFEAKSAQQRAEKEAIALTAAQEVAPGAAIGLSAGTTTWTLARRLREVPGLTIVTNSIRIADLLYSTDGPEQNVVLTGGVRTPSDALVGPLAVNSLRTLHLDAVFLGVHGIDPGAGFTTPNLLEAETDRALIAASRRLVVLADHTKWQVVGISTVVPLADADLVVTDDRLPMDARAQLQDHVLDVKIAQVKHN